MTLSALAGSLFALGEYAESITTAQHALDDMPPIETGPRLLMTTVLVVGLSACAGGHPGHGLRLVASALKHNRDEGISDVVSLVVAVERVKRQARAQLGEESYDAALREGEALSASETIELALMPIHVPPTPAEQAPPR
jgi:hypothetical protein